MMDHGPWDGKNVLPIGQDFHNFQVQSNQAAKIPIDFPKETSTPSMMTIEMTHSKTTSSVTDGTFVPEDLPTITNGGAIQTYKHDMQAMAVPCI